MLKTEKTALAAALAEAGSIVRSTAKVPALQNILIERDDDPEYLVARGGDMDMEVAARFPASFTPDLQAFTCPKEGFLSFVNAAPDHAITIDPVMGEVGMTHVTLRSGKSRLKLPILPADTYPKLPCGELKHGVTLTGAILKKALSEVRRFASGNAADYYLCGVHFDAGPDGLNLLATDRLKLQRRLIPALAFDDNANLESLPKVIVGTAVVDRLIKLADSEDDLTIELSDLKIRATLGDTVLIGKLIEGQFPDWHRITAFERSNNFSFETASLGDALGRVLLATPDAGNGVTFKLEKDALTLTARDVLAGGDGEDVIEAEAERPALFGMHGRNVREALDHIPAGRAEMLLGEPHFPITMRAVGEVNNFTLFMPMQVKGGYAP